MALAVALDKPNRGGQFRSYSGFRPEQQAASNIVARIDPISPSPFSVPVERRMNRFHQTLDMETNKEAGVLPDSNEDGPDA